MKIRNFGTDERAEYDTLVNEVLNGDRCVDQGKVTRFRHGLEDAIQSQRPWAQDVMVNATEYGLRKLLKDRAKAEAVTLIDYRGHLIAKTTRIGRKRRTSTGESVYQQTLMDDFSWDELEEWLRTITSQITSLLINKDMADRLLALRQQFPETATPREACAQLGVSVNEFLATATA